MAKALSVKNLSVSVEKKTILHNIDLNLDEGQILALMGPNGSGKSSLALTIMGHPRYIIQSGNITCFNQDITKLSPDNRAKLGIFLATQNPIEIEGITLRDFLRQAYNALYRSTDQHLSPKAFTKHLDEQLEHLGMAPQYADRPINVGFSGGEKKRAEMLQLAILKPKIAILDEIDSGLDIDALKLVCSTLKAIKETNEKICYIIITHNPRIFDFLTPNTVHIMQEGRTVATGNATLIEKIEEFGFN